VAFVRVLPLLILVDVVLNKLSFGHKKNSGDLLFCYVYRVFSKFPVVPSRHSPVVFLRGRIVMVKLHSILVADVSKV
jgi:hypothetical protein